MFTDVAWQRIFGLFVAEDDNEGAKIVLEKLMRRGAYYKRLVLQTTILPNTSLKFLQ